MNENEVYMIPECHVYRTKVCSQEPDYHFSTKKAKITVPKFDPVYQLELKIMGARERSLRELKMRDI